jgi:hypothetical protein
MSDAKPAPKRGVTIDFGGAIEAVRPRPPVEPAVTKAAVEDAKKAGFSGRADLVKAEKIDRRTLRKSNRTAQLNMKLRPEVRDAFHAEALQFETVEAFIEHLLLLHKAHRRK